MTLTTDKAPEPQTRSALRPKASRSRFLRRLTRNKWAVASLVFVLLLIVVALFKPLLAPYSPDAQDLFHRLASPSGEHWLGTDDLGRDTLSRLIYATAVTLKAVGIGMLVALVGIPLGLFAGYVGRRVGGTLNRLADTLLSLPPLLVAMALIAAMGPGLVNAMVAIGALLAPRFFRITAAAAAETREEPYIEASRSIGVPTWRIMWRHVVPNASAPVLVQASFMVGVLISSEASLSFLGLGVQPPEASWGSMTQIAFQYVQRNSFQIVPPTIMITLTVLAFFVLGDGIRDALGRSSRGE